MRRYLLVRLAWLLPTLVGITLVVFLALHLAPGDPALERFGASESAASSAGDLETARARFRAEELLDQPLWKQYLHFLGPFDLSARGHAWFGGSGEHPTHGLFALDFGRELQRPEVSVVDEIGRRLCVSAPLALAAALLSYLIAIPLGVFAAVRRGSKLERCSSFALFTLHSVPAFWAGIMLMLVFGASGLRWLPVLGLHANDAASMGFFERMLDTLRHALLPVFVLTYGGLAYLSRQMRSGVLGELGQEYVRAARARGLSERAIVWKHAVRNALLPLITLAVLVLPALVGGSVIVETVFGLPGMGRYAWEALEARDTNVLMAVTTLSGALTLLALFAADVLYALVDPRIRHA